MVAKKDKYVFAQVIRDVIEFLEIEDDPAPELTPEALAEPLKLFSWGQKQHL